MTTRVNIKNVKKGKKKNSKKHKTVNNKALSKRITKLEHQSELKYVDYFTTVDWQTTKLIGSLSLLGQGDDFNQRVGEQVSDKFLNVKFRVSKPGSVDDMQFRILIFWDMQCNGVAFEPLASVNPNTGLLDNTGTTNTYLCPLNYRARHRYKVLYDKTYVIEAQSSTTVPVKFYKRNFNLGGATIKYSSSGSAITDIVSRNLCVYAQSSTVGASYAFSARRWYTDA